ncbi:hypothetical protein GCM10022204_25850 [Microlunatus aurantiacus]|uniref:Polysaccharide transporter, PST family n=1 Tax=Microlunatus aurantiacus TaxID=446786 RepID=A0ABP7DMC0_9ACTN
MNAPEQAPSGTGMDRRALRGGGLLAAGTIVERLARLGRNILLARVIAPDQFGVMAIALAVIGLFEAITELGVAQAVIQNKKGDTPAFLNVAWWFGVVRGLALVMIALPLAPLLATFYDIPELNDLLLAAPLTMLFTGLTSPRIYALQRQFKFGATLWTTQGAGVLATIFTVIVGYQLQNAWALMLGVIFEAFLRCVLSFVFVPIKPSFKLDPEARRDLFKFTKGMAGLPLLTFMILQADTFVLGRVSTTALLGLYSMATALANFPLMLFSKVVQPLVVPIFTTVQDVRPTLQIRVGQLSRLVWMFGLPMATIMAIFSEPLLVLTYGRPDFSEVALAFSIYAFFVVVYMASMVSFSVYLAIGKPERQRLVTIVRAVLVLATIYPLSVRWGPTGAALSLLLALVLAMAVQLFILRRVIGLPIHTYLATMRNGIIAAFVAAIPSLAVQRFLDLPNFAAVGSAAAIGLAAWGVCILLERRELRQLRRAGATYDAAAPPGPTQNDL